ncbi:hypothetical protein STEG23_037272 [Scotinomys teguina]
MKTLVLLSALTLLAFSAQADPLPEATEGDKNEEQPGVEDQAVSISFGDPAGSALQDAVRVEEINSFSLSYGFCSKSSLKFHQDVQPYTE